jgi:hypothetical protein
MTDIVERMKNYIHGEHDEYIPEVLQLACAEIERLRSFDKSVTALVEKQANDEGCWFVAETITEKYLQTQLRLLHAAIEGTDFFGFPKETSVPSTHQRGGSDV